MASKLLKFSAREIFAIVLGVLGALLLGVGMCLVLVPEVVTTSFLISGIVIGIVGIVVVAINPVVFFAKSKKIVIETKQD